MTLKYTGPADTLTYNGKTYARPELYRKDKTKKLYAGSFDDPIPITEDEALHLMEHSTVEHSFEKMNGKDLLEDTTAPEVPAEAPKQVITNPATVVEDKKGNK